MVEKEASVASANFSEWRAEVRDVKPILLFPPFFLIPNNNGTLKTFSSGNLTLTMGFCICHKSENSPTA